MIFKFRMKCQRHATINPSRTSSRVLLKESTSCVGNFRMKPTVSESRKAGFNDYFSNCGIKVAKSLFSTKHHFSRWHSLKLIFPHVYPPKRRTIPDYRVCFCLSIALILSLNKEILSRTIRLSVSISVSPDHSNSPFDALSASTFRSLGSKYWHCANSTGFWHTMSLLFVQKYLG
jgi:hypothetical protein